MKTSKGFRESIHNLIRGDRPESPTDTIFLIGSLTLFSVWVYATLAGVVIPNMSEIIGFLVLSKGVKVAANWTKKGTPDPVVPQ